ncbi:MAG: hypothetical protein JWM28_3113 [Chitinophagaceae bacterium]|nr:hypothetical protein [Chitinophagaceae bacterium]
MKRRQFIGLSAYIAAAAAVPFLESCSAGNNDIAVSEPVILLRILNAKSIIETGQAYLKQYPDENTKNKLRDLLLDKSPVAATSNANAIHTLLNAKTVTDFNTGKTVIVNGWVFSRTEARQCALYTLLQS